MFYFLLFLFIILNQFQSNFYCDFWVFIDIFVPTRRAPQTVSLIVTKNFTKIVIKS